ncbi:MAG: PAS domain S-box protein [Gemmatimonadetes bacterium]|nr:MAG: PAS domain S-box protein [Gemmatimonadota bacterium]
MPKTHLTSQSPRFTGRQLPITIGLVIIIAAVFSLSEGFHRQTAEIERLQTLANIVGEQCIEPILENDPASAKIILSRLNADPCIQAVAIYNPDGDIFTAYNPNDRFLQTQSTAGHHIDDKQLKIYHKIFLLDEYMGTVVLYAQPPDLWGIWKRNLLIALVLIPLLLWAQIRIFNRRRDTRTAVLDTLQKPLHELTEISQAVAQGNRLSIRAEIPEIPEMEELVNAFNTMLAKIEQDQHALQQAKEAAEHVAQHAQRQADHLQETNLKLSREIEKRTRAEHLLEHRLQAEQLIANISSHFINLPVDMIDYGVNYALELIGEFLGVKHGYIFMFSEQRTRIRRVYDWSQANTAIHVGRVREVISVEKSPWLIDKIRTQEIVALPNIQDLPAEAHSEKTTFLENHIHSMLGIPLSYTGVLLGFMGFDAPQPRSEWSTDDIKVVMTAGEILVNALERKKAEIALRESDSRFRQLAENIDQCFWLYDTRQGFLYVSSAYERIWGDSIEQIKTDPTAWLDRLSPEDQQKFKGDMNRLFTPGFDGELRIQKAGETRWLRIRTFAVPTENPDESMRVCGITEDITAQKRSENRLRSYAAELEHKTQQQHMVEKALEQRVLFERLIADISTHFINLPADMIPYGVDYALQMICDVIQADHAYIWMFTEQRTKFQKAFDWWDHQTLVGSPPVDFVLPLDEGSWFLEKIKQLETIAVAHLRDLPPEAQREKLHLSTIGVQSFIVLPLVYTGVLIGFLGFDAIRCEKEWTESEISLMNTVAEILVNALERKQAEEALRESDSRFRQLAENINQCFWLYDTRQGFLYVSPAFELIWGFSREALLQHPQTMLDQVIADDQAKFKGSLTQMLKAGYDEEFRIEKADGLHWLRTRTFAVHAEGLGQGQRVCGITEDITKEKITQEQFRTYVKALEIKTQKQMEAEKALAAEKERLLVTLRSVADGVIATDTHGQIVLMNTIAEHLTGWKESDALNKPLNEVLRVVDEPSRHVRTDILNNVLHRGRIIHFSRDDVLVSRNKSEYYISGNAAPIQDGTGVIIGAVIAFHDVTETRRLEQSKTNFINAITHELRTPLTPIIGYTALLQSMDLPEMAQESLAAIAKAADREKKLVEQLLAVARLENSQREFRFNKVNAYQCFTEICEDSEVLVKEVVRERHRTDRFTYQYTFSEELQETTINIDLDCMYSIMENLLVNAVKYSPPDRLSFAVSGYRQNDHVIIAVKDQGNGISKAEQPRIFKTFYQIRKGEFDVSDGIGQGLAIVKRFVEAHDGVISVESELGKGSEFIIELPVVET